jgi:D-alanyl-D-alanine carboxypeptidase
VASGEKNGRRLIGVILGERNPRRRNARMSKILKQVSLVRLLKIYQNCLPQTVSK